MSNISKRKSKKQQASTPDPNINSEPSVIEVGETVVLVPLGVQRRRSSHLKENAEVEHVECSPSLPSPLPLNCIPSQSHAYMKFGTSRAEISHHQAPDDGYSSEQEIAPTSAPDITSQLQGAHHFNISGNPRFENIGVKKEYNYGNQSGTYDIPMLKEFVSFEAMHDSYVQDPIRRVHPGTRQYVLKCICDWIKSSCAKQPIFWLHGPAGVGKSAIAQTVARSCAQEQLAATFFFYKYCPGRNDGNRLFTTLAWQFAFSIPATKNMLVQSLIKRPDLPVKDVETQFEELIIKPFLALKTSGVKQSAPVVIIDGVDECSDDDLQQRFLTVIGNAVRENRVPLRFLICSRPEAHIQEAICTFQSLTLSLDLADLDDANKDIEKYLNDEFFRIATEQELDPVWPGKEIIQILVYKSSGQFVYASTIIKFIGDKYANAKLQLDIILGLAPTSSISPFAELDELYKEVLGRQRDPVFLKGFLSLLIGRDGIRVDCIPNDDAMLMNVSKTELIRKLRGMHSLLKLRPYIDVHHRSFLDFLQNMARSGQYHITKQTGTRRYLDFIVSSVVRYVVTAIKRQNNHENMFFSTLYLLFSLYPGHIVLPVEEWHGALQPLLGLWDKLLALPNFHTIWELLPCKECLNLHIIRDLMLHLAFRLGVADYNTNSAELQTDVSPETCPAVTPSITTEIKTNGLEKDMDSCLAHLLHSLRSQKLRISLDKDTIQLAHSLLSFHDYLEIAMKLQTVSDAQKVVDLIDELINNDLSDYDSDISCKAVRLALEIYARVPVLPQSLFLKDAVSQIHDRWYSFGEMEELFQTAFMGKMLDSKYIVRVSWIYKEDFQIVFVRRQNMESLSQWVERLKPSPVARTRVMLEVANAIQYFHSMGAVLDATVSQDHIFLDSEFHARFLFLGLIAQYVKVMPLSKVVQKWTSYEADVFFFGCLFYETIFDVQISVEDKRFNQNRKAIETRLPEPEIHDDVWWLIQRCCTEDPESRPTMADVVREMEAWTFNLNT